MAVQAHSGAMGGSGSQEFMVRTDAGEDLVAACPKCRYAANTETATSRLEAAADQPWAGEPEKFATPGVVTIEALQRQPYGVGARRQLKTLIYLADGKPVVAVVRGDQDLNEAKLQTATGASEVRPAHPEEIPPLMGAHAGSLGAVRLHEGAALRGPLAGRPHQHGDRRQRGRLPPEGRGRASATSSATGSWPICAP